MAEDKKPQEPAQDRAALVKSWIVGMESQIMQALPKHIDSRRFVSIALTAVNSNQKLMACSRGSIFLGIINAAHLGLEIGGPLAQSYLVPYWNGKTKSYEAQLQVGYQGFVDLAYRTDKIRSIQARVIREGDKFDYSFGLQEDRLVHVPARDRGEIIGVYAIMRLKEGDPLSEVLTKEQIETDHRAKSKTWKTDDGADNSDSPWIVYEEAMFRKTALRQVCKYGPKTAALATAVTLDDLGDKGLLSIGDAKSAVIEADFTAIEEPRPELPKGAINDESLAQGKVAGQDDGLRAKPQDVLDGKPKTEKKAKDPSDLFG